MKSKACHISGPGQPSATLKKLAKLILCNRGGEILDAPSGFGRNAFFLASLGASVVCADNDPECLAFIENFRETHSVKGVRTENINLLGDPFLIPNNVFNAIINVHFCFPNLIDKFAYSLPDNGFLYIETVENRGENYLSCP